MNVLKVKNFWKKKRTAVISCATVCALLLSGCGAQNPLKTKTSGGSLEGTEAQGAGASAKGRYMESPKTTPEGISRLDAMVRLADGSLGIASEETGMVYLSKDEGESWESKDVSALGNVLEKEGSEVTSLALAPDGGVFFSYVLWTPSEMDESGNVKEHFMYVDSAGQEREVPIESKSEDFIVQRAVFGGDEKLYLTYFTGQVYRADLETGSLESVMKVEDDPVVFTASGDYVICTNADAVTIYRISTGEKLETDSVLNDFYKKEIATVYQMGILVDEEQVYTASRSGLYGHVPGGSIMDELLDGGLSNLGDPSRTVVSLLKGKEEGFLIAYNDGEIDSYIYDKDAPAVPEQQLTVYSLSQNDTISKAVSAFRKTHPEVFVKQEIGILDEESMVAEDAVRNLNASLLSGEGPDILVLDGMPKDAYMEKGQLMDLSGFVEKLEGKDSYFHNILTAYGNGEGIYALPIRFMIPIIAGEKETIGKIKNLKDLADAAASEREKKPNQRTVFGTYTPEELLAVLQAASAPAWIKNGGFHKDAVEEYLTQMQKIYEAEHANITHEQEQMHREYITSVSFGMPYADYNAMLNASAAFNLIAKESSFIAGNLNSASSVKMLVSLARQMEGMDYALMPGQSEGVFIPKGVVGISAGTKEEELSLEFLEELFGESVLKNDLDDGYPVSQAAFDEFFVDPSGGSSQEGFSASTEDGARVDFMISWPNQEEISSLKSFIGNLTVPGDIERILKESVGSTGEKVLNGELTPKEGADEIGQKMELYFAE